MLDDYEEITFERKDNQNVSETLPYSVQEKINSIVNSESTKEAKAETKEIFNGAVLGATIGAILSLYRKKSVWLGILAGGLITGYLTKEGIIKLKK